MASSRVSKFEKEMQKHLGDIMQKKSTDWFHKAFITVSMVKSSPDLGYITCYISILPQPQLSKNTDEVFEMVQERNKDIRRLLAAENRHLRKIPEIHFLPDKSLEYVSKMEEIFKKIQTEKPE
jgi:ribosome-binding factor A